MTKTVSKDIQLYAKRAKRYDTLWHHVLRLFVRDVTHTNVFSGLVRYQPLMDPYDMLSYILSDFLLTLGQSYDCPSAGKSTLNDMVGSFAPARWDITSEHLLHATCSRTLFVKIALRWMPQNTFCDVDIGSSYGLVPPGNKPVFKSLLTPIYVAVWRHHPIMP